jgi:PAS domain-containing protein
LYDFAPLGYVTLDEDGYVQEINLAGARLLSADRDALTGYPLADYVAAEGQPALLEHVRQCVHEHREVTSVLTLLPNAWMHRQESNGTTVPSLIPCSSRSKQL